MPTTAVLFVNAATTTGLISHLLWMIFGATLVVVGLAASIVIGQVNHLGYAEMADELLVKRGILFRQLIVVPYGRLQYVEVKAGPLERIFTLNTVQLHTASPGTDARIPGLMPSDAARLRQRLTQLGQANLAGL